MFTNNYMILQKSFFEGDNAPKLTDENGSSKTAYLYLQNAFANIAFGKNMAAVSLSGGGVRFGSGSTPATKSDYCLASPITAGLSFTNGSLIWDTSVPGKYVAKVSHIVTNTSGAEINIYEIGLFGTCHANTTASSPVYFRALFERTVLTEPITIAPGESKMVTYKITFNQTLNVE